MSNARVMLARAGFVIGGALICCAALIAHRHLWRPFGLEVPWGLVLSVAATYLGVRAAGLLDRSAVGAACCAIGWTGCLLYLFGGRTEGDYLIAADWIGYGMLIGGLGAAAVGVFTSTAGQSSGRARARHPL